VVTMPAHLQGEVSDKLKAVIPFPIAGVGAWVVGGAVVRAFRGLPIAGDVDIFATESATTGFISNAERLGFYGWGNRSDVPGAHDRFSLAPKEGGPSLDFIVMPRPGIAPVLDTMRRFDLRCCRAAWNGKVFLFLGPMVRDDIAKGRVVIDPVHSFRADKYRAIFESKP